MSKSSRRLRRRLRSVAVAAVAAPDSPTGRRGVGILADRALTVGADPVSVDVASAFRDPDRDELTYAASSSAGDVAAAAVEGSVVTVTPVGAGTAVVTVTAADGEEENAPATQTFEVTVVVDYDADADGLIEVRTLAQLDAMRYDLDGDGVPVDAGVGHGDVRRGVERVGPLRTSGLQRPTAYGGLYAAWNVDVDGDGVLDGPWDLGTAAQYPALSLDADGDGRASWPELDRQLRAGPALTVALAEDAAKVVLTWTAADTSAWTPPPEVTYTVTREAGATVERVAAGGCGARYVDAGVQPGSAYTYEVAAVVDGGEAARSGLVTAAVPCAYVVTPLHRDVLWTAGTGQAAVTTGPGCAWTAASESAFLAVTAGLAGAGPGTVRYTVAANAGGPRTGALLVAGQRLTVYQASATVFTVRAIHFLELRARIDALRAAGRPVAAAATWARRCGCSSSTTRRDTAPPPARPRTPARQPAVRQPVGAAPTGISPPCPLVWEVCRAVALRARSSRFRRRRRPLDARGSSSTRCSRDCSSRSAMSSRAEQAPDT